MNWTFDWWNSYFHFLYWRFWRVQCRLEVDNFKSLTRHASVTRCSYPWLLRSCSRRASSKRERKGKYHFETTYRSKTKYARRLCHFKNQLSLFLFYNKPREEFCLGLNFLSQWRLVKSNVFFYGLFAHGQQLAINNYIDRHLRLIIAQCTIINCRICQT